MSERIGVWRRCVPTAAAAVFTLAASAASASVGAPCRTSDAAALLETQKYGEARALLEAEELGAGSMRPKVEAALHFVERTHGRAVIAALRDGPAAMRREAGTTIADASPGAS